MTSQWQGGCLGWDGASTKPTGNSFLLNRALPFPGTWSSTFSLLPYAGQAGGSCVGGGDLGGDRAPAVMGPLPWETPSLPAVWEREQPPAQAIATFCVAEGTSHGQGDGEELGG